MTEIQYKEYEQLATELENKGKGTVKAVIIFIVALAASGTLLTILEAVTHPVYTIAVVTGIVLLAMGVIK